MRERYKRRIREFAEQALESMLKQKIENYLDHIPSEIQDIIKEEVFNFPLSDEDNLGPKENLGSKLQTLGREIAEKLLYRITEQLIPFIEKNIKIGKRNLLRTDYLQTKVKMP